jgi:hypothetical protein
MLIIPMIRSAVNVPNTIFRTIRRGFLGVGVSLSSTVGVDIVRFLWLRRAG